MYKQLHEEKEEKINGHQESLDDNQMDSDTPPSDEFLLQLPTHILGFGLYDKKWSKSLWPLRVYFNTL